MGMNLARFRGELAGDGPRVLMPSGVQYFQRLLGYEIARLRLDRSPSPRRETVLAVGTDEVTANVEA